MVMHVKQLHGRNSLSSQTVGICNILVNTEEERKRTDHNYDTL